MDQEKNIPSESSSNVKRIRKGSMWAILGKGGAAFFGFVVSALMARLLTTDEFGAYFLAYSFVSLGAIFGLMGLDLAVVKLVASAMALKNKARSKKIINAVLKCAGISSVVIATGLYFVYGEWVVRNVLEASVLIASLSWVSLWVVVLVIETLIANIFRGFHDIKLTVTFSGLARSAFLSLIFTFLWLRGGGSNLGEIIEYTVLAGLISAVAGFFLLRYKIRGYESSTENVYNEVFSSVPPMFVHAILAFVVNQANIWVLGIFRPNEDVALYGAAMKLVLLVGISASIINAVVPPLIAEKYAQGKIKSVEALLRSAATICGAPGLIVLIAYIVAGEWILSIVFGEFYSKAALILSILSIAEIFNLLTGACSISLTMTGHQVYLMWLTLLRAIFCVVGSVLVVESYGITGVALIYGASLIIYNLASLLLTRKLVGIWTHAGFSKVRELLHL
ncbi:hypothetical protein MNBD_GAMMA10-1332 [hydrothermal vent metagenome]|uniref:Polysaccharide biosynthesis protein C-terminal domain-containing protein n=1 Tax=hydrothermal vent metagenome TaxID=652676 RepID=A0A3B0Y2I5_9ZZZZ